MAKSAAGDHDEAETMLLSVLADLDAHGDVPATDLASVWAELGDLRATMSNTDRAADAYATALARLPSGTLAAAQRADIETRRDALSSRPRR